MEKPTKSWLFRSIDFPNYLGRSDLGVTGSASLVTLITVVVSTVVESTAVESVVATSLVSVELFEHDVKPNAVRAITANTFTVFILFIIGLFI